MQAIVDGTFLGKPSPHLIYGNVVVGLVLQALYQAVSWIPWYGCYLYAAHFASVVAFIYVVLAGRRHRSAPRILVLLAVLALFQLPMWLTLQFTSTALLLGASGVMLYMSLVDRERTPWTGIVVAGASGGSLLLGALGSHQGTGASRHTGHRLWAASSGLAQAGPVSGHRRHHRGPRRRCPGDLLRREAGLAGLLLLQLSPPTTPSDAPGSRLCRPGRCRLERQRSADVPELVLLRPQRLSARPPRDRPRFPAPFAPIGCGGEGPGDAGRGLAWRNASRPRPGPRCAWCGRKQIADCESGR